MAPIPIAEHWRNHAADARAAAEVDTDPVAKHILLEIADRYEKLARNAEARIAGSTGTYAVDVFRDVEQVASASPWEVTRRDTKPD